MNGGRDMNVFVTEGLKSDPCNEGFVLGWGVLRSSPWHLVAVYATKDIAETKAANLGDDYKSVFGSHRLGTDDFVY